MPPLLHWQRRLGAGVVDVVVVVVTLGPLVWGCGEVVDDETAKVWSPNRLTLDSEREGSWKEQLVASAF